MKLVKCSEVYPSDTTWNWNWNWKRLLTLETCCGYGYDLRRESTLVPRIFKGRPGAALPISDTVGFRQTRPLQIKRKTTLPGAPASVSGLHSFALWPLTGGELRLQVQEYWPDSLFVHYLDSGYFKTYIYLNTTFVCNSFAWFKLTIKLENGGHFEFSTPVNCQNL